jgi:hypothetical protein
MSSRQEIELASKPSVGPKSYWSRSYLGWVRMDLIWARNFLAMVWVRETMMTLRSGS